jgi:hypothetical protein
MGVDENKDFQLKGPANIFNKITEVSRFWFSQTRLQPIG